MRRSEGTSSSNRQSMAGMVFSRSNCRRTAQRWMPSMVQSCMPEDAERAAIATTVAQNSVRVAKTVAVFPDGIEDIFVSVGMLLVDSARGRCSPTGGDFPSSRYLFSES